VKQNESSRKVNEQAREVLANILLFEVSDPRLELVTITGCEVSFDRSFCNVFYSCPAKDYASVERVLQKASGHFRSVMAKRLSWRVAPELRFILDTTVDQAARISEALASDPLHDSIGE